MSDNNMDYQNKKKGLGRGLGSLLGAQAGNIQNNAQLNGELSSGNKAAGEVVTQSLSSQTRQMGQPATNVTASNTVNDENRIWKVAIDKLKPGKFQPRKTFEKKNLDELSQSIKENGILQPIIARKLIDGQLEIIAGERRWRASQSAGLHEVPVIIKKYTDSEALELSIIENIQREDLNPIEEAEGYQRLMTEFGMSQQAVADRVGKERATVANAVRLILLHPEIKKMIIKGEVSVGHGKVLLALTDFKVQLETARRVITEKLSVRKLEKIVDSILDPEEVLTSHSDEQKKLLESKIVKDYEDKIQKKFSTKATVDYSDGKGKITINYYSKEEFNNIIEILNV